MCNAKPAKIFPMPSRVWVISSAVIDHVHRVEKLPTPGASVFATQVHQFLGGKGANQAVAAARAGASVSLIGALGEDEPARLFLHAFEAEKIDVSRVMFDPDVPTGQAIIPIDSSGQNQISIFPGANHSLDPDLIKTAPVKDDDIVICQFEVLDPCVIAASQKGRFILNPAPMRPFPEEILKTTYAITPNEAEASELVGFPVSDPDTAHKAALQILKRGPQNVVMTLGSQGAFWSNKIHHQHFPAPPTQALDTVGAGDAFNGSLVARLSLGDDLPTAIAYAVRYASLAVTRPGAIPGMPRASDLE